jgi:hypothetical protein
LYSREVGDFAWIDGQQEVSVLQRIAATDTNRRISRFDAGAGSEADGVSRAAAGDQNLGRVDRVM